MVRPVDPTLAESLTRAASPALKVDAILQYMALRGQTNYDECVTQLEHSLQCAYLARQAGAPALSVGAALLHDVGHFLTDEHDATGDFRAEDWRHETVGADYLAPFLVEPAIEAIRLHVPAKRFLCSTDAGYFDGLSPASRRSFEVQGGMMSPAEVADFRANRYYELAVQLRRWDDGAKVVGWDVPPLEAYRTEVEACLFDC